MPAMNGLLALNYGLRGAAAALLVLLALFLWRGTQRQQTRTLGVGFALSTAAYAIYFAPGLALAPAWWQLPLALLAQGGAVLFWLLASELFDDEFQLRPWHGLVWLVVAWLGALQFLVWIPAHSPHRAWVGVLLDMQPVVFACLGLWRALANWRVDLLEWRRHLRGLVVLATVANIALVALAKLWWGNVGQHGHVNLLEAGAVCAAAFWVVWHPPQMGGSLGWNSPVDQPVTSKSVAEEGHPTCRNDSFEPDFLANITAQMVEQQVYREEDLSIGSLATRLNLQEYQLRRLINQGLGFRNFNAFVNHYRLQEVQAALRDPAKADHAILRIALDCGFASIGPFNRAFKALTGMTPTEFRRQPPSR